MSLLFYNPNIEPYSEYDKRKSELSKLLALASYSQDVKILDCDYDNEAFDSAALLLRDQQEGGMRCNVCFELRLNETARRAKEDNYDIFTTTLSVSPRKNAELLNKIGVQAAEKHDVKYLQADFKKRDGYKRSVELSKQFELYRQNHCGCFKI